jgi:hypothetical protein
MRRKRMKTHIEPVEHYNYKAPEKQLTPKQEEIWVPKNMYSLMLATTANSTSVHFGMNNLCKKHNTLFTLDHIESCDAFQDAKTLESMPTCLRISTYQSGRKKTDTMA